MSLPGLAGSSVAKIVSVSTGGVGVGGWVVGTAMVEVGAAVTVAGAEAVGVLGPGVAVAIRTGFSLSAQATSSRVLSRKTQLRRRESFIITSLWVKVSERRHRLRTPLQKSCKEVIPGCRCHGFPREAQPCNAGRQAGRPQELTPGRSIT